MVDAERLPAILGRVTARLRHRGVYRRCPRRRADHAEIFTPADVIGDDLVDVAGALAALPAR